MMFTQMKSELGRKFNFFF